MHEALRKDDQHSDGTAPLGGTYVTLELAGVTIGVAVRHVREILDLVEIRPFPNAPQNVEGIIDIRGASIPVVDMRLWLGLGARDPGSDTRIVVFEIDCGHGRRPLGIFADRVRDVATIAEGEIEPPPNVGAVTNRSDSLTGLARKDGCLIFLLDVELLFKNSAMATLDASL